MSGRPPKYSDPLKMEVKMDQYFDECTREQKPPTIAGLCYFLGFADRFSLLDYEKRGATESGPGPFYHTVKRARMRIEQDRSERLISSGTPTAGIIFDLTNNHGWKNPQHMKHSGDEDDSTPIPVEDKTFTRDAARAVALAMAKIAGNGNT